MSRILILEDDTDIRESLEKTFREGGHNVTGTADGTEAWRKIMEEAPDGMVLDLEVNGMSGEALLEKIYGRPELRIIPMIVYSSRWTPLPAISAREESEGRFFHREPLKKGQIADRVNKRAEDAWKSRMNIVGVYNKSIISPGNLKAHLDEAIRKGPPSLWPAKVPLTPKRLARVLIIDDDKHFRSDLKKALETWGHEIFEAANGIEGLEKLEKIRPDAITLDLIMPEMSGPEFLEKFQGSPKLAGIPIVVASSAAQPGVFGQVSEREKKIKDQTLDEMKKQGIKYPQIIQKEKPLLFFSEDASIPSIVRRVNAVLNEVEWWKRANADEEGPMRLI